MTSYFKDHGFFLSQKVYVAKPKMGKQKRTVYVYFKDIRYSLSSMNFNLYNCPQFYYPYNYYMFIFICVYL